MVRYQLVGGRPLNRRNGANLKPLPSSPSRIWTAANWPPTLSTYVHLTPRSVRGRVIRSPDIGLDAVAQ